MMAFQNLSAAQKIVLAIDTSDGQEAARLVSVAKAAGGRFVKFGLQLASAQSWAFCAELARKNGLEWIADAKFDDIPNTVAGGISSIKGLALAPYAVTIHATIGHDGMESAQSAAGDIRVLAVTVLTSLSEQECQKIYGMAVSDKVRQLAEDAAAAGLAGIVASPLEVAGLKKNPKTKGMLALIPGSRSAEAQAGDQARTATPAETLKAGADLIVIGREITQSADPLAAYAKIVKEIEKANG